MTMPDDFDPNMPEPVEETDEPDYDADLDFESLVNTYRESAMGLADDAAERPVAYGPNSAPAAIPYNPYADAYLQVSAQKDELARRIGFAKGLLTEIIGLAADQMADNGARNARWIFVAAERALAMLDKGEML